MENDEPLDQWAARRQQRLRPVGQLKAVMLDGTPATHTRPTEPRIILTWDDYAWQPERIADDYAAAQRILARIEGDGVITMTPVPPRKTRIGKHRKP